MTSGHPSNEILSHWYNAAQTLDQNQATNEAFQTSYCTLSSNPIPTQTHQSAPSIS
jgi:hypothetical protein